MPVCLPVFLPLHMSREYFRVVWLAESTRIVTSCTVCMAARCVHPEIVSSSSLDSSSLSSPSSVSSSPSHYHYHHHHHNHYHHHHNNNRIQRRYSRLLTISSQCHEPSPTRTLKWPGRNRVQITCNTSSAYYVQVSCYVPLGTKGQLSY